MMLYVVHAVFVLMRVLPGRGDFSVYFPVLFQPPNVRWTTNDVVPFAI